MSTNHGELFEAKMVEAGLSESARRAFQNSYASLVDGASGCISESSLSAVATLPYLASEEFRSQIQQNPDLLKETVVLKLNGGLGTSMGLDKAKSLLTVKGDDTFLDLMVKQIRELRTKYQNPNLKFVLMNSFSTSKDTCDYLQAKYPDFDLTGVELIQNKAPKVDRDTMKPAAHPANPAKEWCPPGHGDLYPSLAGSGKLEELIQQGIKYMFVSNSDNLGATLDLDLLTYFANSGKSFLMECCERTENDKKGGHLAQRKSDSHLVLRESAQCEKEDEIHFQDITKHRYFNTNNLWIRLDKLQEEIKKNNGIIPLPMIKNAKTVDPQDSSSTAVFQLETAMGAAIECFDNSGAVCVPRSRFAPVKKTDDLLMLRSDAYMLTDDFRPILSSSKAPIISLDSKHFKLVQQLESRLNGGNVPSLLKCTRLKITGDVGFAPNVVLEGDVSIVNNSSERKTILSGSYLNQTIDLTNAPGLGPLAATIIGTSPIDGQKPGTSGLRKKTRTFMQPNYLANFVQSTLDALPRDQVIGGTLVVSGDGRYYNKEAIQIILKIAVANQIGRIWVGKGGYLSTPAVSAVIRERVSNGCKAFGGFILTASHNPGGLEEDFGIKYNGENGGPAPEKITNQIYQNTKTIQSYAMANSFPTIDVDSIDITTIQALDGSRSVSVEVFDSTEDQVALLKKAFDFNKIKKLINRSDFSLCYDSMNGVQGPYAKRVFIQELGDGNASHPNIKLINCEPLEDFGGHHADPNLTYAKELCGIMGIDKSGVPCNSTVSEIPAFGAACDGDADRNMILGKQFFVTPSDSLALIAAHANNTPFFSEQGGLKAIARSMPTSGAVDLVAKKKNLKFFEVPTGWKFFGNLMDSESLFNGPSYTPFICGEESFGTGSNHIREKDGLWAVLMWLNILANENVDKTKEGELVTVQQIVETHWKTYGRNYYCRYDYEAVEKAKAQEMMQYMVDLGTAGSLNGSVHGDFTLDKIDEFTYHDPVDGSISEHQGIRMLFTDGSRVVFRLSGTGVDGATIRMYIEKYEPSTGNLAQLTDKALGPLIQLGLTLSKLPEFSGRSSPSVIT